MHFTASLLGIHAWTLWDRMGIGLERIMNIATGDDPALKLEKYRT